MSNGSRSGSRNFFLGLPMALILLVGLLILSVRSLLGKSQTVTNSKYPAAATIQNELIAAGYSTRMAKTWAAVSAFETGWFSSELCTQYNSFFGISSAASIVNAGRVWDPAENQYMAIYSSEDQSIADLIRFMQAHNYPNDFATPAAQVTFMKGQGFFSGDITTYSNSVTSIYNDL